MARAGDAFAVAHDKLERLVGTSEVPAGESLASLIMRRLGTKENLYRWFASISDNELELLAYDLRFWARAEQIPPKVFETCVILAGRGFGKTWSGAFWTIEKAKEGRTHGALIAPTSADVRDTMVEGESGILALSPPWFRPKYEPSKCRLTWPNGVRARCYSADKPDTLRGPNTGWTWGDEPARWRWEMAALDQIPMFNRIGTEQRPPQLLLTGTPLAGLKKLESLIKQPGTILRTGSSLANAANLAPSTVRKMRALAKTRFGQQEILGLLLMDTPGALFAKAQWGRVYDDPIDYGRRLDRRVISVDPAPSSDEGSDEWGIVPLGSRMDGDLPRVSVLGDLSGHYTPRDGARQVLVAFVEHTAEGIVFEVNTGGEMGETLLRSTAAEMAREAREDKASPFYRDDRYKRLPERLNILTVRAKEAKSKRAEPVAALAESGRIEFVGSVQKDDANENAGQYPKLERQLEKFVGINGRRDDRADAMCWGVHHLAFNGTFWAIC